MTSLPLFPLSSVVLPGGLLPLRIFETRYVDMVRDCMRDSSGFVVCAIREGSEVGKAALPSEYGCEVSIIDFDQDEQGLLTIVAQGQRKVRILDSEIQASQLLIGSLEYLPAEASAAVPEDMALMVDAMQQILKQVEPAISYAEPQFDDALWLGSRFVELLPIPIEQKHELLALDDAGERLQQVYIWLRRFSAKPS